MALPPGKIISQLDLATPLSNSDLIAVVQGIGTKRATILQLKDAIESSCECTVLSRYNAVTTGSNALTYYLQTKILDANTLPTDGSWLQLFAFGTFAANGNSKSCGININQGAYNQNFTVDTAIYNDFAWEINARFQRKTQTTGKLVIQFELVSNPGGMAVSEARKKDVIDITGIDFSNDIQFGVIGINGSASADVTCESFIGVPYPMDPNT